MTTLMDFGPLNVWCVWRAEPHGPQGIPTKIPYGVAGRMARSNGPGTWLSLDEAKELSGRIGGGVGNGAGGGLGVFLGSRLAGRWILAGVDFDCALGAGGMEPWAIEGLNALGSGYWEISPSGTGIKAFGLIDEGEMESVRQALGLGGGVRQGRKWKMTGARGEHPPAIEIYTGVRFFAVTGKGSAADLGVWGAGEALRLREVAERQFGRAREDTRSAGAGPDGLGEVIEIRSRMNALDGGLTEEDRTALAQALKRSGRLRELLEDDDMTSVGEDRSSGVAVAMGEMMAAGLSKEGVWQVVANAGFAGWYREKGDRRQMERAWQFAVSAREAEAARLGAGLDALPEAMLAELAQLAETVKLTKVAAMTRGSEIATPFAQGKPLAPAGAETPAAQLTPFADETLAREMVEGYGHDLRYVDAFGRWMVWQGHRWRADDMLTGLHFARQICSDASRRAPAALRKGILSGATIQRVEKLARADRRVATTGASWDTDPWLLNTPLGVVDLRTGAVTEGLRSALMTKSTSVGPDSERDHPVWSAFLDKITAGNKELQAFLQRMAGYCLTGITREHALFFCHGTGRNGKSTFLETLGDILGAEEYAQTADGEIFMAGRKDQHSTEIARLRGARLVITKELDEGRAWSDKRIKEMTGGDLLTANFMRQDKFTFKPEFKLLIAGNHKPRIRSVDEAMRRRINLIPFLVTIGAGMEDKDLPLKLRAEHSAILHWLIRGCLTWQQWGLMPPDIVRAATADYLEDEDTKTTWFEECCTVGKGATLESDLFISWKDWAAKANEPAGTQKTFSEWLRQRSAGFELKKNRNKQNVWVKIMLVPVVYGKPEDIKANVLTFPGGDRKADSEGV